LITLTILQLICTIASGKTYKFKIHVVELTTNF
jgi:hypothetical protein